MRRLLYVLFVSALLLAAYLAFTRIQASLEIAPTKRAVLAMKTGELGSFAELKPTPPPSIQPNIILIVADDLGWRDVGYNHSEIRTPIIDGLASSGITLNRFYVQPTCSPTRAALLTGKSPISLGVVNPLSKLNPAGLPISELTLADRLKSVGYQTALVGKWHLGPRNLRYHPNARGFEYFYGHLTGGVGYYDKVHGGGYDWQRNGKTVRDDRYATHLIADDAGNVIRSRDKARPLFLYVAFGAPHLPNEAPQETIASYANIGDKSRRIHAAMVTELDTAIGQIVAALEAEDIQQDTLIWFMSDNGGLYPSNPARHLPTALFRRAAASRLNVDPSPKFTEFLLTNLRDGGSDNRPFRGGKQTVWEGGVRVPAFVHWPAELEAQSYNYMTTVQDVSPTLLQIAGVTEHNDHHGRALWAHLRANQPAPARDYIVQAYQGSSAEAIYDYPFKLVERENAVQLFDLENDPLERRDIAKARPDIVADLSARLAAFPRADSISLPLEMVVKDPDYFGGEEDRLPWADQAYLTADP